MANNNDIKFALKAVDQISAVIDRIQSKLPGLRKEIDNTNKMAAQKSAFTRFGETVNGIGKSFSAFGSRMTASVSLPLFFAGKKAVETASTFQTLDIALTTMLGNAEKAKKLREELTLFATKTPFQITDIGQTAKQLLAVGINQEKLIPTLKSLGDVAAGLNVPLERIVMNYGQVRTQNKLTGREMKDFLVAGIPLVDQLAKQLNVKKSRIPDLVSAGKITFAEVEKAFNLLSGTGGKFENMMGKISQKTFEGKFSNFIDQITLLGGQLGEALIPDLEKLMGHLAKIADLFSKLSPDTKTLIAKLALFATVLGPALLYIGLMMQGFSGISIAIGFLSSAFSAIGGLIPTITALFAGLSLATVGWIAGIAALVAAGIFLWKNWDKVRDFFETKVKPLFVKFWDGPLAKLLKFTNPLYWLYRLGSMIYNNWGTIKPFFIKLWDGPIGAVIRFITPIDELIELARLVKNNWEPIANFFENIWDAATKAFDVFILNIKEQIKAFGTLIDFVLFGQTGALFSDSTVTKNGVTSENTAGSALQTMLAPSWMDSLPPLQQLPIQTNNSKVVIDFKNVPKGTDVKQIGSDDLDLNLGYAF